MRATATSGPRAWILAGGLAAVALAVGVMLVVTLAGNSTAGLLGDLDIYRGAVNTALAGQDLYSYTYIHPTVHGLGFTYPPFAALVLVPFALLASLPAKVVWTALTFLVTLGCLYLLVRTSGRGVVAGSVSRTHRVAWVAGLSIPVMLSYPFLHNLGVGQVSLFVVTLALFDHLLPRRWQGSLVGIAAAIKLTPLVFLPYYLVTKQWRQAAVCTGAFLAATALAWLVLPGASLAYWTDKLWQTGRVGRTDSTVNKSLLGLLARQLPDGVPTTLGWLAGCRCGCWRAGVLAGCTAPAGRQPTGRSAGRRRTVRCRIADLLAPPPAVAGVRCLLVLPAGRAHRNAGRRGAVRDLPRLPVVRRLPGRDCRHPARHRGRTPRAGCSPRPRFRSAAWAQVDSYAGVGGWGRDGTVIGAPC